MIRQYIKSALRNIQRNRLSSFINIFGLTIGLSAAIIAMLFSYHEFSYETYHEKADRLAKVVTYGNFGAFSQVPTTFSKASDDLPATFPEIENAVVSRPTDLIAYKGNEPIHEKDIIIAEADFQTMFSFDFILGECYGYYDQAIALSASMAQKYFGNDDPVGKNLKIDIDGKQMMLTVSGVFKDLPTNTIIKTEALISWSVATEVFNYTNDYNSTNFDVFCLVNEHTNIKELNGQIAGRIDVPTPIEDCTLALMPIKDFHLRSVFENNKANLYILFFGGLIALIIAIFNYISQASILYSTRMQEVGVRLSNGGRARDIFKQFLVDTFVLTFIGFALAVILVIFFIPEFNNLVGTNLKLVANYKTIGLTIALFLVTVFLSGFYPSIVMARLKPVLLLHSSVSNSLGKSRLRNILTTVQFVFAILLLQMMMVTQRQGEYLSNSDVIGFNSDNVIVVSGRPWGDLNIIKDELLRSSAIKNVSWAKNLPAMHASLTSDWKEPGNTEMVNITSCEPDFLSVFQIQMARGRFFSSERKTDHDNSIVVNNILVNNMGWDQPIGKRLMVRNKQYTVIGVVGDYMAAPPIFEPVPFIMLQEDESAQKLVIRIDPQKKKEAQIHIKTILKQANPNYPIQLGSHDELMEEKAKTYYSTASLVNALVIIIIINAFLSLFGLSHFIAERSKKQIGVNKVFGASVLNIYWNLIKSFVIRFIVAFSIITPLSYLASIQYVSMFSIKMPIRPNIFLFSGVLVLIMVLISTGFKIIKAATRNPVEALRYE